MLCNRRFWWPADWCWQFNHVITHLIDDHVIMMIMWSLISLICACLPVTTWRSHHHDLTVALTTMTWQSISTKGFLSWSTFQALPVVGNPLDMLAMHPALVFCTLPFVRQVHELILDCALGAPTNQKRWSSPCLVCRCITSCCTWKVSLTHFLLSALLSLSPRVHL
jgi:hypothetical protein